MKIRAKANIRIGQSRGMIEATFDVTKDIYQLKVRKISSDEIGLAKCQEADESLEKLRTIMPQNA